jgi:5-methylthioadenosine/S-adenosylhomocysteine deaminase
MPRAVEAFPDLEEDAVKTDVLRLESANEYSKRSSRRALLKAGAFGLLSSLLSPDLFLKGALAADNTTSTSGRAKMLLQGGIVLSLDKSVGDFNQADVLIDGGKIVAVARKVEAGDAEVIDASGMIVMPGFIDTHRHMWQGLLRNIGPNDLLGDYLGKILFGFAPVMTPDEVYIGNLITALSAMNSGITSMLDWSHIATSPDHTDAAIKGLQEANIRAVYGYGPNFGLKPAWFENPKSAYPDDIRRLRKQHFSSNDQLLTLALAAAGPEFSNVDAAVREWTIAREVGARISVHVGVGLLGKKGALQALGEKVKFGPDTTYIHCCTLSNKEWSMMADSGANVSLAIPIEMQMGHGMPPIQKALDMGIRPSLSIDVETNQPTDMFTQMRACFALQRALLNEKNLFGGPEPDRAKLLTVRDVMEFATVAGAKANGLGDKIGTLTPGKRADVIMLRGDNINVTPLNDVVGDVVLGMDTANVDAVFVDGRAIKRGGKLVNVDLASLRKRAAQARAALLERAKIAAPSL